MTDWLPHNGGTMPVDGHVRVDVRFTDDGFVYEGEKASYWSTSETDTDSDPYDYWEGVFKRAKPFRDTSRTPIIAYRIVEDGE